MKDEGQQTAPETMCLDTCEAPAALAPRCTRDSLLKPPDWRYQAASQYLADLRAGVSPVIPADPVVQLLIRGLRGLSGSPGKGARAGMPERYLRKCWPVMFETLAYGMFSRRSAVAAMLDTCLIKGWTHEEAQMAGCPVGAEVYELYGKAFFDLSGVRAVHCWIQDFLFEPERYSENTSLLRARLLAYFGDGGSGVSTAVSGMLSAAESDAMKRLIANERQKKLFDYVVKKTNLPPDVYAGIMETAIKSMTEHDFQERMKDREDAGSSSMEELAVGMEEGIRAYSQHDHQPYEDVGLDFVNQYTRTLTRSVDDGKHDNGSR